MLLAYIVVLTHLAGYGSDGAAASAPATAGAQA
jgi:hypothetical protein